MTVSQETIEGIARTLGLSVEQVNEHKAQLDRLNNASGETMTLICKYCGKPFESQRITMACRPCISTAVEKARPAFEARRKAD